MGVHVCIHDATASLWAHRTFYNFFFFFFFPFFLKLYPQMVKDGEHPLLKNSGLGVRDRVSPRTRTRFSTIVLSGRGGAAAAAFVSEHQSWLPQLCYPQLPSMQLCFHTDILQAFIFRNNVFAWIIQYCIVKDDCKSALCCIKDYCGHPPHPPKWFLYFVTKIATMGTRDLPADTYIWLVNPWCSCVSY